MTVIKVDCTGEICPVPLVETHKAVRRSQSGDIIEVTGTHPSSKKDIQVEVKRIKMESG